MPNEILWKVKQTATAAVAGASLNALANGSLALGSEIDNRTNKYQYIQLEADLESIAHGTTSNFEAWLLQAPDGTNYEDGGASTTPARAPDVVIPFRNATAVQRVVSAIVSFPPNKVKVLVKNNTGVALTSTNNNALDYIALVDEVQ